MSLKMAKTGALLRIGSMGRRMKEVMTSGMLAIHHLIGLMSLRWMTWILRAPRMAIQTIRKNLRSKTALSSPRKNQSVWKRLPTKTTRIVSVLPISIMGTLLVNLKTLSLSSIKSQLRPSAAFYLNKAMI
jgi:hypothetical protein